MVCARRADVGRALLMPSARTAGEDPSLWPGPDTTIADGFALIELLPA